MIAPDDPRHGSRAGYLAGCHCPACTAAHTRWCKHYRIRGERRLVSAVKVRRHVEALRERYSAQAIADAAGLSVSTVHKVATVGRVNVDTARKLLAVKTVSTHGDPMVRGLGTTRRVRALNALGWPLREIADRSGLCEQEIGHLANDDRGEWVHASTAAAVSRVYDDLSMTVPVGATRPERSAHGRARNTAARKGWVPPLAWDDIDTDPAPPTAEPTSGDLIEDAEWLARSGAGLTEALTRLDRNFKALERAAYRAGRADVLTQLRDNERRAAA